MKMQCSCPLLSIDHKRTKVHERIIYQYDKRKTKTGLLIHDETREIIVQETVQFLRGDPHLEAHPSQKKYFRFLHDHDDVSIGHGTHSNRRTMSQPQTPREYSCYRKPAKYTGAAKILFIRNNYRTVMQGRIFKEDIFKQLLRHDRTDQHTRLRVIVQLRILGQHDQSTRFCFRKVITGLHDSGGDLIFL